MRGYSQIDAVLKLISIVNRSGIEYDYLHFFQGADLPIKTQDEIHKYFEDNNGYEFVSVEKDRSLMAQNKAWYRHFFCHNRFFRKSKFMKSLNFGLVYVQKLLHIRKNLDIDLYQGSALFSITGGCARYIETQTSNIHKRFRYSLAADEVFLQTILMNSFYRNNIKDVEKRTSSNARMIDRTRPDGKNSPHTWRKSEGEFLLSLPREYCFARKFEEKIDYEIVEKIYHSIKGVHI